MNIYTHIDDNTDIFGFRNIDSVTVGIVRVRTKATEYSFFFLDSVTWLNISREDSFLLTSMPCTSIEIAMSIKFTLRNFSLKFKEGSN